MTLHQSVPLPGLRHLGASPPVTNGERLAEELRILRAVADGRMFYNEAGRWVIEGEARPDRKTRERLVRNGYVRHVDGRLYTMQSRGKQLLEAHA